MTMLFSGSPLSGLFFFVDLRKAQGYTHHHFNVEASVSFNVYFAVQECRKVDPDIFRSEADVPIHCIDVNSKGFDFFCLDFNPIVIHVPKPMVGTGLQKEVSVLVSTSFTYRCLQLLETPMSPWHSHVSVWRSFL